MVTQEAPWSATHWEDLAGEIRQAVGSARSDEAAWALLVAADRRVLRAYSTSFFTVTRFLPVQKRAQVEAIYAAVRYPDEIVDTFPWSASQRLAALDQWEADYLRGSEAASVRDAVRAGVSPFLAGFAEVVQAKGIPPAYYIAFLDAMRRDVQPRPFATLEALIDEYIYGSAVVVGYFLTYVYGAVTPGDFPRALAAARTLGIALQLTNFVRDVAEDQRRGRCYLPLDMTRAEGIAAPDVHDGAQQAGLTNVVHRLADHANRCYAEAQANLDAFAPDSRTAIDACIRVYGQLNDRIRRAPDGLLVRQSVPMTEKLRVLPSSKYWRLPIAYLRS